MRGLTDDELLRLWEESQRPVAGARAAALLAVARPGLDDDGAAALTIGERDAALVELREAVFGPQIGGYVVCPACGQPLELQLDAHAILAAAPEPQPPYEEELAHDGYRVRFRPLTCGDLEAASRATDASEARVLLLRRSVLAARRGRRRVDAEALPEAVVAALADRLAAADPQAEIRVALTCPECAHGWRALFDAASFLWLEIGAEAKRLLTEIALLARSYGWGEADILALSPPRRQRYLELAS